MDDGWFEGAVDGDVDGDGVDGEGVANVGKYVSTVS